MRSESWQRVGGLAGVLGVVVPAIGLVVMPIWNFPTTSASGTQIADFAVDHRRVLQVMMLLYTVGVVLWLVFGAAVWAGIKSAVDVDSVLPTCFAAGLIGFVTLLLSGFTAFDVLLYRPVGAAESHILYDLAFGLLAMSGLPTALCSGAFAVAVYRYRFLPTISGHWATATAVVHLVLLPLSLVIGTGVLSLEGPDIAVVPAFLWTWILVTGLVLLRSTRADPVVLAESAAGGLR